MDINESIEIYSLQDVIINTALGKNVVLNGQVYTGNGVGIRWTQFKDRFTVDPEDIFSRKDVIIRTDIGKKVSINGTDYVSTTGIAKQMVPTSKLYVNGINWYCKDNIIINIAPGQKIIINDIEITGTPDGPSTATVSSLSPNNTITNSGQLVTVNGTGFTAATLVYVSGGAVQTSYLSATALTTTYLGTATVGTIPVGVKKPGEVISNTVNFTVNPVPPAPVVSGLSPSTLVTSSGTLVTVNGSNFVSGCSVQSNGVNVQTTYVSATQLTTTHLGGLSSAQTVAITVKNPDNQVSNSVNFILTAPPPPAPTIGSLSPSTLVVSSGTLVTVTGTNFVSGCVIKADGVGVQTTFVSATSLTSTYFGTVASAMTISVTVQNPDTQTSNAVSFSVTAAVAGPPVTSGLIGRYDPSVDASITYSNGTDPANPPELYVSAIADLSGAANHGACNSNPAYHPRRNVTINGLKAINFDATGAYNTTGKGGFEVATIPAANTRPVTYFYVYRLPASWTDAAQFNAGYYAIRVRSNNVEWLAASQGQFGSGPVAPNTLYLVTATLSAGGVYEIRLNGISQSNGTSGLTAVSGPATCVGAGSYIAGSLTGYLGESLMYNRVLSAAEIGQMEVYLQAKWGTPALPSIPMTGLDCWWDAADTSTIVHAAGVVSNWKNKAVAGVRDLNVPSTAPGNTVTGTRTMNGKNALDFKATGNSSTLSTTDGYAQTQPVTMFCAIQSDLADAAHHYILMHSASSPSMLVFNGNWTLYGGALLGSAVAMDTNKHVFSCVYNTATSQLWLDGVSIAGPGSAGSNTFSGQPMRLSGTADDWDGLIGEVLIYNRLLTTTERQQVESYLKTKWGTP